MQHIALMLHRNRLLPHYQLALQTLTPEALRLSNRSNMSSNEYEPIAKSMAEQGVPIAAELIWGLPGREEYCIEAIPVAGYGKAKGEYVVGCHSFTRDEGEEGYFLITAHMLLIHGHIMPLTTRLLALKGDVPVSPLLREVLRGLIEVLNPQLGDIALSNRMDIYEQRDRIYLAALDQQELLYHTAADIIERHHICHGDDCGAALQALQLDKALCPRRGAEQRIRTSFSFDGRAVQQALAAMELPTTAAQQPANWMLGILHPGGVGDILQGADGGSWLSGSIEYAEPGSFDAAGGEKPSELALVAIA